jgi:hypothetical protein
MTKYAIIEQEFVTNISIADEPIAENWIECSPEVSIGWAYKLDVFSAPEFKEPVHAWYIDRGPFYDRFGPLKIAILTSTDAGVKAILADLNIREYVDLKRSDVFSGLKYIQTVIPALTDSAISQIINKPVLEAENYALRVKLYGGKTN